MESVWSVSKLLSTESVGSRRLPPPNTATEHYNLRSASSHNKLLPARTSHLTDANFISLLDYCIRTLINQSIFISIRQ